MLKTSPSISDTTDQLFETGRSGRPWVEGGLIVLFWTLMAILLIMQRTVNEFGPFAGEIASQEIAQAFVYYLYWVLITPFVFWLSHRFGFDREDWYKWIVLHVVVAVVVAMVAEVYGGFTQEVFGFHSRRGPFRNDPLRAITEFWWMNELFLYVAVLAAGFARGYFLMYQARREEAVTLMAEKTHLQAQLAETRLMSLRMQLNPHFLFNTLNAVSSLVDRDPRGVRRMIARLSELLRHTLDGDASQEISLQEELEFVDRYLDIEQIRFQGKLEIDKDVPCDVVEALVPNMILQPLVENAVKHGATRNEGVGRIDIAAWRDGDSLFLSVQDNGPGFNNETTSNGTGVGLKNTRARLEALYGDTASLNIKRADDGGVIATIRLPFHLPVNRPEAGS